MINLNNGNHLGVGIHTDASSSQTHITLLGENKKLLEDVFNKNWQPTDSEPIEIGLFNLLERSARAFSAEVFSAVNGENFVEFLIRKLRDVRFQLRSAKESSAKITQQQHKMGAKAKQKLKEITHWGNKNARPDLPPVDDPIFGDLRKIWANVGEHINEKVAHKVKKQFEGEE